MQSQQNARAKRVAGAGHAGNVLLGQIDRRLPEVFAFACAGESALGEVDNYEFLYAELQHRACGVAQRDRVDFAVCLPCFESGCAACFELV